jgi:hypothetical protein
MSEQDGITFYLKPMRTTGGHSSASRPSIIVMGGDGKTNDDRTIDDMSVDTEKSMPSKPHSSRVRQRCQFLTPCPMKAFSSATVQCIFCVRQNITCHCAVWRRSSSLKLGCLRDIENDNRGYAGLPCRLQFVHRSTVKGNLL